MIRADELPKIDIGTKIVCTTGAGGISIATVDRLTSTMIILSNGTRLYRKSGEIVGKDSYSRAFVELGTPEKLSQIREVIKKKKLIQKIRKFDEYEELDIDTLEAVLLILENQNKGK